MATEVSYKIIGVTESGERFVILGAGIGSSINNDNIIASITPNTSEVPRWQRFDFEQDESGNKANVTFKQTKSDIGVNANWYIVRANLNSDNELTNDSLEGAEVLFDNESVGVIFNGICTVYINDGKDTYNVILVIPSGVCSINIENPEVQVPATGGSYPLTLESKQRNVAITSAMTQVVSKNDPNGVTFIGEANDVDSPLVNVTIDDGDTDWVEVNLNGTAATVNVSANDDVLRRSTITITNQGGCSGVFYLKQEASTERVYEDGTIYIVASQFSIEPNDSGTNEPIVLDNVNTYQYGKIYYSATYGKKYHTSNGITKNDNEWYVVEKTEISHHMSMDWLYKTNGSFDFQKSDNGLSFTFEGNRHQTQHTIAGYFLDKGQLIPGLSDADKQSPCFLEGTESNDDDLSFLVSYMANAKWIVLEGEWVGERNIISSSGITAYTKDRNGNSITLVNEHSVMFEPRYALETRDESLEGATKDDDLELGREYGSPSITPGFNKTTPFTEENFVNLFPGEPTTSVYDRIWSSIFFEYDDEIVMLSDQTTFTPRIYANTVKLVGEWVSNGQVSGKGITLYSDVEFLNVYSLIETAVASDGSANTFPINGISGDTFINGVKLSEIGPGWIKNGIDLGKYTGVTSVFSLQKDLGEEEEITFIDETTFTVQYSYTIESNAEGCKVVIDEAYRAGLDAYEKEIKKGVPTVFYYASQEGKVGPDKISFRIEGFTPTVEKSIRFTDDDNTTTITYDQSKTKQSIIKSLEIKYKSAILPNNGKGEVVRNGKTTLNILFTKTDKIKTITNVSTETSDVYNIYTSNVTNNQFVINCERKTAGDISSAYYETKYLITTEQGQTINYFVVVEEKDTWSFANVDYLVFTYEWEAVGGQDLDTLTVIETPLPDVVYEAENGNKYTYKTSGVGVGYKNGSTSLRYSNEVKQLGDHILVFAGDNTRTGGEYTLIDFERLKTLIESNKLVLDYIDISINTIWYASYGNGDCHFTAKAINSTGYDINDRKFTFYNEEVVAKNTISSNTFNRSHKAELPYYQSTAIVRFYPETGKVTVRSTGTNQFYEQFVLGAEYSRNGKADTINVSSWSSNSLSVYYKEVKQGDSFIVSFNSFKKEWVYPSGSVVDKTVLPITSAEVKVKDYKGADASSLTWSIEEDTNSVVRVRVTVNKPFTTQTTKGSDNPNLDVVISKGEAQFVLGLYQFT